METITDSDDLQNWLQIILTGLVSNPKGIEIEKTSDEMGVRYIVQVAKEDRGKVIGRQGAIAQALRTLVRSAGFLIDIRATMVVDVPRNNFSKLSA